MGHDFQPRNIWLNLAVCLLLASNLSGCRLGGSGSVHLQRAEELSRQKNYDEAINEYRKHMDERLKIKDRPEWENPYFYLILIGDIQLGQGDPLKAKASYDEAEKMGVDAELISDRYRSIAAWYEQHEKYKDALDLLNSRRSLDPLLFDSILDRVSKEMVKQEESQK